MVAIGMSQYVVLVVSWVITGGDGDADSTPDILVILASWGPTDGPPPDGVYVVDDNYNIVRRKYFKDSEQKTYKLYDFVRGIDESMPKNDKIGKEDIDKYFNDNNLEITECNKEEE